MKTIYFRYQLVCTLCVLLLVSTFTALTACAKGGDVNNHVAPTPQNTDNNNDNMNKSIRLTIGQTLFTATLENNATVRELLAMLPMTLHMSELNGNEKYCYISSSLPTEASTPGTIRAGDIMLYGSSCIVVFYKTFTSSYSYTPIGHIDNADGLEQAVGKGSVNIAFALPPSTGISSAMTDVPAGGARYALNGTMVPDDYKGIYIQDGKKYYSR